MQLKHLVELRTAACSALGTPADQRPFDNNLALSMDFLTRHIRQFGKLFRRMQQLNNAKFVELNSSKDIVLYYWSKVVEATDSPPNFIAGK